MILFEYWIQNPKELDARIRQYEDEAASIQTRLAVLELHRKEANRRLLDTNTYDPISSPWPKPKDYHLENTEWTTK